MVLLTAYLFFASFFINFCRYAHFCYFCAKTIFVFTSLQMASEISVYLYGEEPLRYFSRGSSPILYFLTSLYGDRLCKISGHVYILTFIDSYMIR